MFANFLYSSDYYYNCQTTQFHNKKDKVIEHLLDDETRPPKQKKIISPLNRFVIHYDTSGVDAVDLTDMNNNSIPDYIDSVAFYFDYAYTFEIDSLGYAKPPIDSMRGGDNLYDVYVANLVYADKSLYGFTVTEDIFENEYKVISANSFITIDNNYSENDSIVVFGVKKRAYHTTGIDAVQITSAHEFHHAIQYGYGIPSDYGSLFMEMTSTWIEYCLYSNIYDFTQYVTDLFKDIYNNKFTIDEPTNGYRWSIFLQYLAKSIDKKIIKDIWNDIPKNINFFKSLEHNLLNYHTDIKKVWNDFVPYLYFTSTRTIDSVYFNSSSIMPKLKFTETEYLNDKLSFNVKLEPFQIWTSRIVNSSDYDRNIESIDILASYVVSDYTNNTEQNTNLNLDLSTLTKYSNLVNYSNNIYYQYHSIKNNNQQTVLHIFVNDGVRYGGNSFAFTNPNNPNNDMLFVSLPLESRAIDYDYVIYNMEMLQIESGISNTQHHNGYYGIEINNKNLTNGIYYYHIYNKNNNYYGKFSVLRK